MAAAVGHRFRKLARTRLFTAKGPMLSGVCFLAGYDDEKQCQKGLARIAHTFNCSDVWELRHVGAANGETALKVNSRFLSNSCDHAVSTTRAMMAALWVGDKTRVSLARPAIRLLAILCIFSVIPGINFFSDPSFSFYKKSTHLQSLLYCSFFGAFTWMPG